VLTAWNDVQCLTLLGRPIFDEGIYSTVRFHHRSVREYLVAEWLHKLIVDEGSRVRVEGLFFRSQYGIDVIVPTMRPVLPWLVLLDERILARVCRIAPEVVFEGGDPSQLPLGTRVDIIRQVCEQLSQPAHRRSLTDYDAVQRFANVDLTAEIISLINQFGADENIAWFLLRMVEKGELVGALDKVVEFARESSAKYVRIAAIRALGVIGSEEDRFRFRELYLAEANELNRDWLAEIIPSLPSDEASINWLLAALSKVPSPDPHQVDWLADKVTSYIAQLPPNLLKVIVPGLAGLLVTPPLVERRFCELSVRYKWIFKVALEAILRLIKLRDNAVMKSEYLSLLCKIDRAESHGEYDLNKIKVSINKGVLEWFALNREVFWYVVSEARAYVEEKNQGPLVEYWRAAMFGKLWGFSAEDFGAICEDIENRPLMDDRLVALSVAFAIYRENNRPPKWRKQLKRLTGEVPDLKRALDGYLHPKVEGAQEFKREEAKWKRQAAREKASRESNERKWKDHLSADIGALRSPPTPGVFTQAQFYLLERMREKSKDSGHWTDGDWTLLSAEFGEDIASAFRDGAVDFWRRYIPKLASEGATINNTEFAVIFGLAGLAIEAREVPDWLSNLTHHDVNIALKFALHELNGFPNWLPGFYMMFPQAVVDAVLTEIDFELSIKSVDPIHYVLSDASWSGAWMWDRLAPHILDRLRKHINSYQNLLHMLKIVQGSSIDDKMIADLAAKKARSSTDIDVASQWFSVWVGVDPAVAIPALASRLAALKEKELKSQFAANFIVGLLGGRREGGARQLYRTVEHMKSLYLLMHEYLREEDDIIRVGKGVYSPGPRDDAQDGRNAIFSFIRETPGKEAFLALMEISRAHPTEASRPWIAFHAKEKATADADRPPWLIGQVREFHDRLESTPSNHRDLWYLIVDRFRDLKLDLEDGDSSNASLLVRINQESEIRKFIGNWCRDRSAEKYSVPQEEELADAKRPDFRFHGVGFDGPVPVELKLADNWTGPRLFERLEVQLCGDYLRDARSSRGVFVLVYRGEKKGWDLPNGKRAGSFRKLVDALQNHWAILSTQLSGVEEIEIMGIDLTKRSMGAKKSVPINTKKRPVKVKKK